jgi:aldose 1-epimerase
VPIEVHHYGSRDGTSVGQVVVDNEHVRAVLLDYGARLVELHVPDRRGIRADVVLAYPDLDAHLDGGTYLGATCGRFANRIGGARFTLDGTEVRLLCNEGHNHLHGGPVGFDRHVWDTDVDTDLNEARQRVRFRLVSPAGDQGYPGELTAVTEYVFAGTTMTITMTATTTAPTVVNLVHHSYWNLAGHGSGDVLDQELLLESDVITPVDDELLPTGEIHRVAGTPFDFRTFTPIGARIRAIDHRGAGRAAPAGYAGYDHNWAIRGQVGRLRAAASARDPASGRRLDLRTNEAGVQVYTGGYFDGVTGKSGAVYGPFQGFTLETQRFPDSPNVGHFPPAVLRPGELYEHVMELRFSTDG